MAEIKFTGAAYAPPLSALGVKDEAAFQANLRSLLEREPIAMAQAFYLEALSIRHHVIDWMLRMFIFAKVGRVVPFGEAGFTLGRVIRRAADCGFPAPLIGRLEKFNEGRTAGIHRLLTGDIQYEDLRQVLERDRGLFFDVGVELMTHLPSAPMPPDSSETGEVQI